jgi:hypothetical protein
MIKANKTLQNERTYLFITQRGDLMQVQTSRQRKTAEFTDAPLIRWWIRITSPHPKTLLDLGNAQWREEVVSLLIPITIVLALIGLVTSLDDIIRTTILSIAVCCLIGIIFLKRSGNIFLTSIALVILVESSLFAMILTAGGGQPSLEDIPLMDHLLMSVVVAMASFTPPAALFVGLINCLFMVFFFQFYPHGGDLPHHLSEEYWAIVLPPILLHLFTTSIFFIMMRALTQEIKRADNAEELIQLKNTELKLRELAAERSKQLEEGTHAILQTLSTAVSQTDFSQRVPLAQDNLLWRIAYAVNNLLARLQSVKQEKTEMERTRAAIAQLRECIKQRQAYPLKGWTGTMVDPLIMEFNQYVTMLAKSSDQQPPYLSY